MAERKFRDGKTNACISKYLAGDGIERGMGATLAAALVGPDHVVIANVNDGRAYAFQDGDLRQVTRDHSWVRMIGLPVWRPLWAERCIV